MEGLTDDPSAVLLAVTDDIDLQAENSDVLSAGSVAVAVKTFCPAGTANVTRPMPAVHAPLVATVVAPRKVRPPPLPEGLHEALA